MILANAEKYLLEADELVKDDPTIDEHLGDLYFKTGNLQKAQDFWKRSISIGTEQEDIQKVRRKLDAQNFRKALCANSKTRKSDLRFASFCLLSDTRLPKINLALSVLGRRTDGYHDIQTVFQTIDLCDELEFRPSPTLELRLRKPSRTCRRKKTWSGKLPDLAGRRSETQSWAHP